MKTQRINTPAFALTRGILTAVLALTFWAAATNPAQASLLIGTGTHLILPPVVSPFPGVGVTFTENSPTYTTFTQTWGATALTAWQGTFTGTGPIPGGARPAGTSLYDFSGLNATYLPVGTTFILSDLDNSEHFTIRAWDTSNNLITTGWLSEAFEVTGAGSGAGGAPALNDMPGWDLTGGLYTFRGTTIPGNPSIAFGMENLANVSSIEVNRDIASFSFGLLAPVPEPTMALFAGSFGALFFFRRNRSRTAD